MSLFFIQNQTFLSVSKQQGDTGLPLMHPSEALPPREMFFTAASSIRKVTGASVCLMGDLLAK